MCDMMLLPTTFGSSSSMRSTLQPLRPFCFVDLVTVATMKTDSQASRVHAFFVFFVPNLSLSAVYFLSPFASLCNHCCKQISPILQFKETIPTTMTYIIKKRKERKKVMITKVSLGKHDL